MHIYPVSILYIMWICVGRRERVGGELVSWLSVNGELVEKSYVGQLEKIIEN